MNNRVRLKARETRRQMDKMLHAKRSAAVCGGIFSLQSFKDAKVVMTYFPIDGEVDVSALLESDGKTFCVPKMVEGGIVAVEYSEHTEPDELKVPAPIGSRKIDANEIDLIVVPLVAFDGNKNRLGFGKGCYDEFLKRARAFKVGAAFECQRAHFLTHEKDVTLDIIVTEDEIF